MKYEAKVEAYELDVTRDSRGGIISIEANGPIREDRGNYVYEYPPGRMNTIQPREVLVVWGCGIHQCYPKAAFEEQFQPRSKPPGKPGRPPKTKVVLTETEND
jgi:hypothetical protein